MRKIFLAAALFLLLLAFLPKNAFAQGTHKCTFRGSTVKCAPADTSCTSGYEANLNYCDSFDNNQAACNGAPATNCVAKGSSQQDPTCSTSDGKGINTAIGCIPIEDTNAFIGFILRWAIGIGGGIAFLLILYAGFMIMSSSGNPDRLKAGQELMTSAIAGLIMLIFSVFILRVIGVDILGLPIGG